MNIKYWVSLCFIMPSLILATPELHAESDIGQSIQIYTQLRSFTGRPSWLIVIRDIDNGKNLPYIFDFERGDNFWVVPSFSRNYLVLASTLHFSPSRYNPYGEKKINNFCNLESNGQILRGQSMYIMLKGDLTPNKNTVTCHVSRYSNAPKFDIVSPGKE